jgi:hypothetical protein
VTGRRKAIGKKLTIQEINRDIIRISRVVIHPKYRTIGLRAKIVAETLPQAGKPYVETIAVMAKYNPFFEKAGMTKNRRNHTQPQHIEGCGEAKKIRLQPGLSHLRKSEPEQTAKYERKASRRSYNGHQRGHRHLQEKTHGRPTGIPEQTRIRSPCRRRRHSQIG